ncbi:metallophosphoesterase [Photobacterium sp. J15]|uniref:metallophosphoesterase n=1 Tax=Photobacterium sp. J15 TaxID=265901 RepID=UPI0007E36C18|nr:metallophosphoesterase [Photobacterium sp. J15]
MLVQYLSDLHLEFMASPWDFSLPETDADLIILAGDIGTGCESRYIDWVLAETKGKQTIVVAGNHEPYGSILQKCHKNWRTATRGTHVHFLEQEAIEIDHVRFLGATLYTDYRIDGNPMEAMNRAAECMNDHRKVHMDPRGSMFRPIDALDIHYQTLQFLESELQSGYQGKTVIVSHHAPSAKCFPDENIPPLAAAYASNLEELMERYDIAAWFHGHIHSSTDLTIHNTRVLANPRGYWPMLLNDDFDPARTIEI